MHSATDLIEHDFAALPRPALAALRAALLRDAGAAGAGYLQEAGFAGGDSLVASFERWLAARGERDAARLGLGAFESLASTYFREMGWGTLRLGSLSTAVATLDSVDWSEADPGSMLEQPGCHFSTGMFAYFFGKLADVPVAVLEVECRSSGADRCRFLLGSTDVMDRVFDRLAQGADVAEAVGAA
jgi:predicted hydrocarbon binding protein